MGVILHYDTDSDDIFLDPDLSPTIRFWGSFLLYIVKTPSICLEERSKVLMTREANVFKFGCLFHEMAFNVEILVAHEDRIPPEAQKRITNLVEFKRNIKRPAEPEIPDTVWKLIQLCRGEDPKRRPTMDEVVMEMERWVLPPLPDPQRHAQPEDKSSLKLQDSFSE
ncbi:hypothetical protein M378DRAFT_168761 [Amanita muscaria Koide BX008]|uniref:Serine-threonine/tyrosine-protein kinase catalytic domain-containing protein n=1 Tax=Amanita muscaria (strain Koide BX008) TaxID=946122 RepID=A0A0C2WER0_AMAMK|nr:hypothetical protein M378DRAFT_168761 [Amanita muscaria Koide BX008]